VSEREVTFTQLGEDQELGLSGVRLFLADGSSGAELDHVGVTRQLFLESKQVKEHTASSMAPGQPVHSQPTPLYGVAYDEVNSEF